MVKVVLDTTVLVSAFLRFAQGGVSSELLRFASEGRFELYLSKGILEEVRRVLLSRRHLRDRYRYPDAAALERRGTRRTCDSGC